MFRITLQGAVAGNHGDFEKIIELYAPLIDKHCYSLAIADSLTVKTWGNGAFTVVFSS